MGSPGGHHFYGPPGPESCLAAAMIVFAVLAHAQAPAAGQKQGLAASMQTAYSTLKGNMTQVAEKMPDANYGFHP